MSFSLQELVNIIGNSLANTLMELSIKVFEKVCTIVEERSIIIADTKFEFGMLNDEMILIDEILTPDSSRFWSRKAYKPGQGQDSYDKQIVRDYLNTLDWDKTYPGPVLPEEIAEKTRARYVEILQILTGQGCRISSILIPNQENI